MKISSWVSRTIYARRRYARPVLTRLERRPRQVPWYCYRLSRCESTSVVYVFELDGNGDEYSTPGGRRDKRNNNNNNIVIGVAFFVFQRPIKRRLPDDDQCDRINYTEICFYRQHDDDRAVSLGRSTGTRLRNARLNGHDDASVVRFSRRNLSRHVSDTGDRCGQQHTGLRRRTVSRGI